MAFPSATFKKVAKNLSQAWWQSICQAGFNEQPAGGGWWWLQRFLLIFTP